MSFCTCWPPSWGGLWLKDLPCSTLWAWALSCISRRAPSLEQFGGAAEGRKGTGCVATFQMLGSALALNHVIVLAIRLVGLRGV
eukprot:1152374-Pelagomonas_calceolata.AAC.8